MKFRITLKDPDGVWESLQRATADSLSDLVDKLDPDELEELRETRIEKFREKIGQWFKHQEYLTVEIDTEASTCTVIPND